MFNKVKSFISYNLEYIIPAVVALVACVGLSLCCILAAGGALNPIGYITIIL